MNNLHPPADRQAGFSLIEILIAILVFAIAMLALAQLQGRLARVSADADLRRVAINIAEELLETQRGFGLLETDPDGHIAAYADISNATGSLTRGNMDYGITQSVADYFYDPDSDTFTTTNNTSALHSDFKEITIDITWDTPGFVLAGGQSATSNLGSGSVSLQGILSSATSQGDSQAMTQSTGHEEPLVDYTPGANPDIMSLSLGDNKFKESTVPEPDVIRLGELVESRFDVITYSQTLDGALFLRREQFSTVSCDCTLRAPPGTAENAGRRPTIWAGDEYMEGHDLDKPYGESANNLQSPLCVTCCKDHHDGGSSAQDHADTAVNVYDPFRPSGEYYDFGTYRRDHKHYDRTRTGDLVLAVVDGDPYVEACRLVRKDGFFKVAQDFRQEDLHVFPDNFLDETAEVEDYSSYVTNAANAFENATYPDYETNPPCIGGPTPPCVAAPNMGSSYPTALQAGELPSWTRLPLNGSDTQQLRSRGIYIDYLSSDMRNVVDCLRAGGDAESCHSGDVELDRTGTTNILEIIPFFDVQLTSLYRWTETPTNTPVDTTNEGLEDLNTHSRGLASTDDYGCSTVESRGHRGNLGFTDTAPVSPTYGVNLEMATISVQSLTDTDTGGCTPGGDTGTRLITGTVGETVNGLRATDIEIQGVNGVLCDRTPDGFECYIADGLVNPRMLVYDYDKVGQDYWACLTGNDLVLESEVTNGIGARATFALDSDPAPVGSGYDINVQDTACY